MCRVLEYLADFLLVRFCSFEGEWVPGDPEERSLASGEGCAMGGGPLGRELLGSWAEDDLVSREMIEWDVMESGGAGLQGSSEYSETERSA